MTRIKNFLAALWRPIRENARKLIPSRSVRWVALYVPAFTLALLFAINVFGGLDDLQAYVIEVGVRSLPVLVGIALVYGFATGLGWNIDNKVREQYQRIAAGLDDDGFPIGAIVVLAAEMLAILALLVIVLAAMLVWQG